MLYSYDKSNRSKMSSNLGMKDQKSSNYTTLDEFDRLISTKISDTANSENLSRSRINEMFMILLDIAMSAYSDQVLVEMSRHGMIQPDLRFCCMRRHKYSAQECIDRNKKAYRDSFAKERAALKRQTLK